MEFSHSPKNIEHYLNSDKDIHQQRSQPILKNLCVHSAGYYPKAFGHNLKRSPIDEFVVIYCISGKGFFKHKNRIYEVKAGHILYCWEKIPHRYWADVKQPWSIYWTHITGNDLYELLSRSGLSKEKPILFLGIHSYILRLFRDILDSYKETRLPNQSIYASSSMRHILSLQLQHLEKQNHTPIKNSELNPVLKYMTKNINKSIDIKELAHFCHLSEGHFIRKFKKSYGSSPMVYFNKLKIQEASQRLLISNNSIKEIAYDLGFHDPQYFSRLFKKTMGISAMSYRKEKIV